VILTERELREGHRAANCAKLLSHLIAPFGSEADRAFAEHALRTRTTPGDVAAELTRDHGLPDALAYAVVWNVVARAAHEGRLICDLDGETLDAGTLLSAADPEQLRASA
jgi:hypothetical protein